MTDFFAARGVEPATVLLRLIAALVLGGAVAWIHDRTSRPAELGASFPATLVLLSVLIAMVTQVIGDNVARAFSLVGALSIVRFRTVVRDTRDTAFVIFAVVVGMAAGAQHLWVALFGLLVAGSAAFVLSTRGSALAESWQPEYELRVRAVVAVRMEQAVSEALKPHVRRSRISSIGTVKQGTAMEGAWELTLPPGEPTEELVRVVSRIEGVQDVRLARSAASEENQ